MVVVKAVLGQLKRSHAIKHLSLERQSSGSDGGIGGRNKEFLLDGTLWGRLFGRSGGSRGFGDRGRSAEGWERLPACSGAWKLRIYPSEGPPTVQSVLSFSQFLLCSGLLQGGSKSVSPLACNYHPLCR